MSCLKGYAVIGAEPMKASIRTALVVAIAALFLLGCARMPKPERSAKVIKSYFKLSVPALLNDN